MLEVLAAQFGIGVTLSAALWGAFGSVAGYSALLGCLIAALPNAFLALRLSLPRAEPGAKALMRAAYIGELGKLAITLLMFGIVFVTVRPIAAVPLFATFAVTALAPSLGLLVSDRKKQNKERLSDDGD